jgi:gliding motility-associated-like protein
MNPLSRRRTFLILLGLLFSLIAFPATIIVSSNADSGPGTLRDALTQAAGNGTTNRDSIIFAIPDNSLAGRTITLLSKLPVLTSNLVINGVSQNGGSIGSSQAQILLYLASTTSNFNFLEVDDCIDVGIYGLAMISTANTSFVVNGITYVRCHNLQIGRPGAGNYMLGCTNYINSNTGRYGSYILADTSRQLTIQSNVMGLDISGGFSNKYAGKTLTTVYWAILLLNTSDITLGGDDPAQGNTIVSGNPSFSYSVTTINIQVETYRYTGNGRLTIRNNKLGTRVDGTLDLANPLIPIWLYVFGGNDYSVRVIDNLIQGHLYLNALGTPFTIQGNTIWATTINTSIDYGITILQCSGGGVIGGDLPGQPNTIYNNYSDTIYYFKDNPAKGSIKYEMFSHPTIKKNITLCNNYYGSGIVDDDYGYYYDQLAWVRIDYTGINFVRGKATPNTRIDVYLDDDCAACEGKTYLGFTMANADSSWQFTGSFNAAVVATSTSSVNGQTSEFSQPFVDNSHVIVKQPTCGGKNGSIKGMRIIGGDNAKWHLMRQVAGVWTDSIYSTKLDLDNAEPGIYFFDAWLGKSCRSYYVRYDLRDIEFKLDASQVSIQNASCGKFNGSITNIQLSNTQDIRVAWKNAAGVPVSDQLDLMNAGAGQYKLVVLDSVTNCGDSTGFYTVINQTGPTVDISAAQATPASCGLSNGSITNVKFSNVTGTAWYGWLDSLGHTVGNEKDLTDVPAGKYRLKFKDLSSCDTITTPPISIAATGIISFDASARTIVPSKCNAPTGSIGGITVVNGSTYTWIDTVTRSTVSNSLSLDQVSPGYYKLIAFSAAGCTDSTQTYVVGAASVPFTFSSATVVNESCYTANGQISINDFSPTTGGFSFSWIDNGGNPLSAAGLAIQHLTAGVYSCYVTDVNGCRQLLAKETVREEGVPQIDYGPVSIQPDICTQSLGAISQLGITGSAPFYYTWMNVDGNQVVGNTKDLRGMPQGAYYLIIKDGNNCADTSRTFTLTDSFIQPDAPVYKDIIIVKDATATLTVLNPINALYDLYASVDTTNAPAQQNASGNFVTGPLEKDTTLYVVRRTGSCPSAVKAVPIKVVETLQLLMPNAFTPNGDGHNDLFNVKYPSMIRTFHMVVFNRYGQRVCETADPLKGWNGRYLGVEQPTGNYVWIISYVDVLGNRKKLSGNVFVVR